MKTIYKTLLIGTFLMVARLNAQQNDLFNTYFFDPLLLNIAYSAEGCSEATLNYRNQWMGIKNSPKLYQVNARLPFEQNAGLGLRLSSQQAGLFNTLKATLGYGYQVKIDARSKVLLGLGVGFTQNTLNTAKATVMDDGDATIITDGKQNAMGIDVEFGAMYLNENFKAGVSVFNLYSKSPDFVASAYKALPIINVSASYLLNKDAKVEVEPLLVNRLTVKGTNALEGILNFHTMKLLTFGVGYRTNYGALAIAGIRKGGLTVAYSFDYRIAKSATYTGSSHQVLVGYKVCKARKAKRKTDSQILDVL